MMMMTVTLTATVIMCDIFRCQEGVGHVVDADMRKKWNALKDGYRKYKAKKVLDDGLSPYEGKDSISREGFLNMQRLALQPAHATPEQMLWIPALNAGTRNLVARVCSIGKLTFATIGWKGDAMIITLPRHKGDPGGERVMERHVHANPHDPWGCFIFWLGIRILSSGSSGISHYVFGEDVEVIGLDGAANYISHKDDAFGSWIRKVVNGLSAEEQLAKFGTLGAELGTQSNRKGGLEDMTTSPDGPPPVAALLRAGKLLMIFMIMMVMLLMMMMM